MFGDSELTREVHSSFLGFNVEANIVVLFESLLAYGADFLVLKSSH
jgi:hypothetical protein